MISLSGYDSKILLIESERQSILLKVESFAKLGLCLFLFVSLTLLDSLNLLDTRFDQFYQLKIKADIFFLMALSSFKPRGIGKKALFCIYFYIVQVNV